MSTEATPDGHHPGPSALRVLLLAPYPLRSAPSQRFRFEQYLGPLAARGISVDVSPLISDATHRILHKPGNVHRKSFALLGGAAKRVRDLMRARRYDLVFVHREAFPLGPAWVERLLRVLGVPYVFDFDDAIYITNVSDANRFVAPLKFAKKVESIARGATLVLAGNEHLASWASTVNSQVEIVPTTIDTDLYQRQEPRESGHVCVGWSGSLTTVQHLATLEPVLRDLQRDRGVRLRVIGDDSYGFEGANVEALPWSEQTELDDLAAIDIGIMPLPDEEWAKGKCGLKALQYMALGIPTVMSPVGVNVEIAAGDAAVLADSQAEWRARLRELVDDPARRAELGRRGRERVLERYSIDAAIPLYEDAIRRAARLDSRS